jgi:hypothetical protein
MSVRAARDVQDAAGIDGDQRAAEDPSPCRVIVPPLLMTTHCRSLCPSRAGWPARSVPAFTVVGPEYYSTPPALASGAGFGEASSAPDNPVKLDRPGHG